MPRHTILSDGSRLDFPDGLNNDQMTGAYHAAEKALFDKYTAQAAQQGGPVHTNSTIYSGTRAYPNNWHGNVMAWLDTHDYGDQINRSQLGQTILNAVSPAVSTGARIATNALNINPGVALADLGVGAYNTARGIAQRHGVPGASYLPYGATAPEIARQVFGVPELAPDAGPGRRALEDTASLVFNPSQSLPEVAMRVGGSEATSDVAGKLAEHYLGPDAGDIARFGGGVTGASPGTMTRPLRFIPQSLAHENAPDIADAAKRIEVDPSFTTLANPSGQRIAKWLGSTPFFGAPIEKANERTRTQLQGARDQAATDIAGTPDYPTSPEEIGSEIIGGAQQATPTLKARLANQQDALDTSMRDTPVDVRPIVEDTINSLLGNRTTPSNQDLVMSKLNELRSMAPGGANYDTSRGPVPPLPQPTLDVPWSAVKDWRSQTTYDLNKPELRVPDNLIADLKGSTTGAMQDAAQSQGQGDAFDLANRVYAQTRPVIKELTQIGGKPITDSEGNTTFQGGMNEKQAYNLIDKNLQSPSELDTLTNPSYFDPNTWRRAAGGYVSTLGDADQGTFRPEHFARDWDAISDPVKAQLTTGPSGAPLGASSDLEDAATVGRNFVTPVSRHGLTSQIGTGVAVETGMSVLGEALTKALGLAGGTVTAGLPYLFAKGMESQGFRNAMTGSSTPLVDQLYQGAPAAALGVQGSQTPDALGWSVTRGGP